MGRFVGSITLDEIGIAELESDPAYDTDISGAWSRAMARLKANPVRLKKAVTISLEKMYGLPHGRYGEDASQKSYWEKLLEDPEGMKILRGQ